MLKWLSKTRALVMASAVGLVTATTSALEFPRETQTVEQFYSLVVQSRGLTLDQVFVFLTLS